jgi:L-cysteine desulfidase
MRLMKNLPGVQVSVGCTEPAAIALATSLAFQAAGGELERISINCDMNLIKNAYNVGIVGVNHESGINGGLLAAALGAIGGRPDARLSVLNNISEADIGRAKTMVEQGKVEITLYEEYTPDLYMDARVYTDNGTGRVIVTQDHTNVVAVESNGRPIPLPGWSDQPNGSNQDVGEIDWGNMSLEEVWASALDHSAEDRNFLLSGVEMNLAAAERGLQEGAGLGLGDRLQQAIAKELLSDDLENQVAVLAAAASDARMSGLPVSVMTSGYSGNQGIVATLPVLHVARTQEVGDIELANAIAVSHCTIAYVKSFTGNLSALCNAILAGSMGAASGIIYLLGGNVDDASRAISLIVANTAGAVCDGAKPGCAIKVSSGASQAVRAALLAVAGVAPSARDGIVGSNLNETLRNVARLSNPGMRQTNEEILSMILSQ